MTRLSIVILAVLALWICVTEGSCQSMVGDEQGLLPYGSYHGGDVDAVNLENGNLTVRIPLFSLPQKGKLSLSYSLILNNHAFAQTEFCDDPSTPSGECYWQYVQAHPIGPMLVMDQAVNLQLDAAEWPEISCDPDCPNTVVPAPSDTVIDATGASHPLLYDTSDWTRLHAVDGSGYTYQTAFTQQNFQPWAGNPIDPNLSCSAQGGGGTLLGVVYTPDGISHTYHDVCQSRVDDDIYDMSVLSGDPIAMQDRAGNTITYSIWTGQLGYTFPGGVTDSIDRTIPDFYQLPYDATVSSRCPNLGVTNQTVEYSKTWIVPGPNDGTATYTFCMTWVDYNTLFGGGEPGTGMTQSGQLYFPQAIGSNLAIQSVVLPNGTFWGFVYDSSGEIVMTQGEGGLPLPDPTATPIEDASLTKLILPTGGTIAYSYSQYDSCNISDAFMDFVSSRTINDLSGLSAEWQYSYENTTGSINNGGVVQVVPSITTVTDPMLNDTVHTYSNPPDVADDCNYRVETEVQHFSGSKAQNVVLETSTAAHANATFRYVFGTYAYNQETTSSSLSRTGGVSESKSLSYPTLATLNMPYCNYTPGVSETACPLDYDSQKQIVVDYDQNSAVTEWLSDGSYSNEVDKAYQFQSDSAYLNANLLSLVSSVTTTDKLTSSQVSKVTYKYDENNGSPQGSVYGNLTSVHRWVSTGGPDVVTGTVYDAYGMPKTEIDANQYQTAISYQCALPYTVTNAAGQTTTYTYNCNIGKVKQIQTANDVAASRSGTVYSYNDYGDLQSVSYPDGGSVTVDYHSYGLPLHITTTTASDPNPAVINDTYYDGMARVIKKSVSGGPTVSTTYDALGNVSSMSNAYYESTGANGVTSYTYDPLGRMRYQCQPDNGTSAGQCAPGTSYLEWSYSGDAVDYYDEDRHHWQRTFDPLGRLTKVLEPDSTNSPALETDYTYDPLNNLSRVDQWGGAKGSIGERTREFHYDSLSRLSSSSNPESGGTTYSYLRDSLPCSGDPTIPCSKTDARSVTAYYNYDTLNRLTSKSYSDSSTPLACFQYSLSGVTNGIGRLANEWTQEGSTTCSATLPSVGGYLTARSFTAYDPMGRLWSESDCTTSGCRSSAPCQTSAGMESYSYDLAGNLTCSGNGIAATPGTGPQPVQFSQSYDSAGRLLNLTTNWQSLPSSLASIQSYSPSGDITGATYGSGAIGVSRSFDVRQRIVTETDTGIGPKSATSGTGSIDITGSEQTK